MICRELVKASNMLHTAIPVRIGFDYNEPCEGAPTQWATMLTFFDETRILLPLSLSLRGQQTMRFSAPDQYFHQGWTIDHEACRSQDGRTKEFYHHLSEMLRRFSASPVLHITDVDMLFLCDPKALNWRPRRFSTNWTLYDTVLHATWRRTVPASPVIGIYSDLSALVNKVYIRGSRINILADSPTETPFQLYREEDFTLSHMVAESNIPIGLISQVLKLESNAISHEHHSGEDYPEDGGEDDDGNDEDRSTMRSIKRQDLMKRNSIFLLLRSGERIVDENPRCEFQTCSCKRAPSSRYCEIHSTEILRLASMSNKKQGKEDHEFTWQLSLTPDCESRLRSLKSHFMENPQANWIIDFEFLSVRAKNPIPLQVSIRQMDGKPLLDTNVDYDVSLAVLIDAASLYTGANMGPFLSRLYRSYRTNGRKPSQIRDYVLNTLRYSPSSINIFSWYSAQDMQCFQRILTGSDDIIVERQSHTSSTNFNKINIPALCQRLLPSEWPSMSLGITHSCLLKSQLKDVDVGLYHNASYDTQAVSDIVKAMIEIV